MASVKNFLKRPVAWGAVLLSYAGIIGAVAYAASTGATNAGAIRAEQTRSDARIERQADRSRNNIVRTGRIAIKSGCLYDNERSHELKHILRVTVSDPAHRRELTGLVSTRNCKVAANVLTDEPKKEK